MEFVGKLIAARLFDLNADYIHGGVDTGSEEDDNTREAKIKKFHEDPNSFVLVANPAACGESISLHKVCHHAIYLDRTYNAAHYMQSEDRIHRLGLPSDIETKVEILTCNGTIDESINNRLIAKISRMKEILNDDDIYKEIPFDIDDELGFDADDYRDLIDHVHFIDRSI